MGWGQGEVKNVEKMTPAFFWVENQESFGFFPFLSRKGVSSPDSMGFVWGEVGRALMQFMHFFCQFMQFLVAFPMSAFLATLVTLWYPL